MIDDAEVERVAKLMQDEYHRYVVEHPEFERKTPKVWESFTPLEQECYLYIARKILEDQAAKRKKVKSG